MKSLMQLLAILLNELGRMMSTCTTRDLKTITRRVEDEGMSFLTITLPSFNDEFQTSLDRGFIAPASFPGFRRAKGLCLPAFLQGFTEQVFDSATGVLLDEANPEAIRAVRQITLLCGKVNLPCSEERDRKAIRAYIECEKKVRETNIRLTDIDYQRFRRTFDLLFGDVLSRMEQAVYALTIGGGSRYETLRPKHGPGKTADRLSGNEKWRQSEWTRRLDAILPIQEMLIPNWRHFELLDSVDLLEPGQERPVKVVLVPKTLKTPRIIAIEPTAMQYAQQALAMALMDEISVSWVSPMIGFHDQEPNQFMAQDGSFSGNLATLDLSSASDLVSNQLVIEALKHYPHFSEAVQASRSLRADVPGYGVIPLAKFASMGSALTFPIEAMVFLTVTIMGVLETQSIPVASVKKSDLRRLVRSVRVYGDDIIAPTDSVRSVIQHLETYGFEVGLRKSFWTGSFRESCGKEYFAGHDVSIVRLRQMLPTSLKNVDECISTVSFRNQLYSSGLWDTSRWLDDLITRVFKGNYPAVFPTSPVLGRHAYSGFDIEYADDDTHSPLVRGFVPHAPLPINPLEGEPALLKWLLKRGDEPYAEDHLERSGRPDAVYMKLRWRSPY